jgi:PncC family amidohydrolase
MRDERRIAQILTRHHQTLSLAESCTGGLLASRITDVPGSSLFFKFGVVAYCNQAKIKILGITPQTLKKNGAVSGRVSRLMAKRIRTALKADYGIGITGIAGPTGGSKEKPVGLVFISIAKANLIITKDFLFKGSRVQIKKQAAAQALKMLLSLLPQ